MAQKIRVFTLAREFGLDNDAMVEKIQEMGVDARNYMSALDADLAQRIRRSLQKERADNTIEERIRPTVVRRRTKDGAPSKPMRVRPPKVESEAPEASAPPAAAPVKRGRVKPKADAPLKSVPDVSPEPISAAPEVPAAAPLPTPVPEPPVEAVETAVTEPFTPEAPEVAGTAVSDVPDATPAVEVVPAMTAPSEAPVSMESEPVAPPKPSLDVPVEADSEPVLPSDAPADPAKGKRPRGIEVAAGPAIRRPSAEAPVIRRRVTTVQPGTRPRQPSRPSTPSVGPRGPGGGSNMPDMSAMAGMAGPAPKDGQPTRRGRGAGPQRRREVQSRDMVPQGRFSGVGPAAKFGGATPPGRKRRMAPGKKGKKTEITTPQASKRVIRIEEQVNLQELAKRMGIKATELLTHLMGMGVGTLNINSILDVDTAKIVASDFGYDVENVA